MENGDTLIERSISIHRSLGHCSPAAIRRELEKSFWHPALPLYAQEALRLCENCSFRLPQSVVGQTLDPLPPTTAFARWGMDYTGPVMFSNKRFYLLNAIDYATSWAYSVLSSSAISRDILILLNDIINVHGSPRELVTDNEPQFVSAEVVTMLQAYNIEHRKTTPYHPRANGKCERFNGIIKQILLATLRDNPSFNAHTALSYSLRVYRQRPQSHGYSPYFLAFGCDLPQARHQQVLVTYICA